MQGRVDHFGEVVRGDLGRHTDRDALGAVHQEVRETRRQHRWLLGGVVVVRLEVDRLFVDRIKQLQRQRCESTLGVTHGRGALVGTGAAEVAVAADEWMTHREVLHHSHEGVVDRRVAVRVVRAHDLAHDLRALRVRSVGSQSLVEHRVQDASMHGLEAVANVGQGARDDDRHRVLEERSFHLEVDLDGFDVASDLVLGWWRSSACVTGCACHMPLRLDI